MLFFTITNEVYKIGITKLINSTLIKLVIDFSLEMFVYW
jgi:hypothetical protein